MIVCYTRESLHLRLRSHHIPGCNLDISVYDSVFRHRRFWSMLTMHPRNPNLHNSDNPEANTTWSVYSAQCTLVLHAGAEDWNKIAS